MTDVEFTDQIEVSTIQQIGSDEMVVAAARVSTVGEKSLTDVAYSTYATHVRLISYLMREKHGSPFEHGSITFLVTAPIFVFWDHVRHRIGVSYNIESSRYRELRPVFFIAPSSRVQSGKPGAYVYGPGSDDQDWDMRAYMKDAGKTAWGHYKALLDCGIAREQAMQVLPMNTVISGYVTFNPRSLMNFVELRHQNARAEMQSLAASYLSLAKEHWPITFNAFEQNKRVAP